MTGLAFSRADLHDALLDERNLFQRHFDAEVAAGDHDAVEGQHDVVQRIDRLWLLDLGDDRTADPDLGHDLVHQLHVLARADEGQRDEVDAQAQGELEVLDILLRHRRHADVDAGQRQALVVADDAALSDVADDVGAVLDAHRDEGDVAVVDEQPIARAYVGGQVLVGGRDPVMVAGAILDGDPYPLTGAPLDRAVGEAREPDLGPLQVGQHGQVAPGQFGGGPHLLEPPTMVGVLPVAEVQPGHVHPGVDEGSRPVSPVRGRP